MADPTVPCLLMSIEAVTATVADVLTLLPVRDGDALAPDARDTPEVRALVAAARQGDAQAFGALVALYQTAVRRAAVAALGASTDAEDVAQDAFLLAWRKLPGFRGESSFRTWLLTIAWRQALDRRRRQARWWARTSAPPYPVDVDVAFGPDPSPDPEQGVLSRDLARRVAAQIGALTPKLRDTLLLASTGEHSYEEIATMLGIPLGTVKWRVSEARRLVRAGLDHG